MGKTIYLDESGCLGWKLDEPYGRGGSSQFFTLAAVIVPDGQEAVVHRIVRGLYKRRNRPASNELKSVALSAAEREHFAHQVASVRQDNPEIRFATITVRKENVQDAFRRHPNGLYNYMVKLLLLRTMAAEESICFIPDCRTIKVELKHAMHDYLRTELATVGANTFLQTTPWESKDSMALQFADILAGIVWAHHEHRSGAAYRIVSQCIHQKSLFFNARPIVPDWDRWAPPDEVDERG
ncbi:DUF3800 domain-containing protein [Burkholderia contaminans]|uniref:DUF3800 domain-containing protein n=1 Tax=Burkholderia contaminans TaxID=488447 RepID=UPI00158C5F16|nr:DUF3800 domain-containing protein [Burkholderia contaminans]